MEQSVPSDAWLPTLGVSGFALIAVLSIALVAARSGRQKPLICVLVSGLFVAVWAVSTWFLLAPPEIEGPNPDGGTPRRISCIYDPVTGSLITGTLTDLDQRCRSESRLRFAGSAGSVVAASVGAATVVLRRRT